MKRRLLAVLALVLAVLAPQLALGASAPAASASCEGYTNKKWARTSFVSPKAAWHFAADNRKNPEPVTIRVQNSVSGTKTTNHTYSGEVSTSVKAGLKFLAEGKVDAKFGTSYSTEKSVTGMTTVGWELKIPAYTKGTWDYGFFTVTAFKSRVYRDYQCRTHTVYKARKTWPVYSGWKYRKLAYQK
ncbi:MAG TPA: hypothetical protein VLA97_16505 [Nocardioidaceae bacterium]|nr:hypothetical protein [Nocardioidaceae bacterium]